MSTKKQLENTGDSVCNIKFLKSGIKIELLSGDSYKISEDAYVSGPKFYKEKVIGEGDLDYLKSSQENLTYELYLSKLINSGRVYSKKKILEKLMNVKSASYEKAMDVINNAYARGLIDDVFFIQTYIQDAKDKGYSKSYIFDYLIKQGYDIDSVEKEINEVDFDHLALEALVDSLFKKYSHKNFQGAKESVFSRLFKMGYSSGDCHDMISHFLVNNPQVKNDYTVSENEMLRREMNSAFEKFKKLDLTIFEIRSKVISVLLKKKYNFDDIMNMWEEQNYDIY